MNPKQKKIVAGSVLGVLFLVFIYVTFLRGDGTPPLTREEIEQAREMAQQLEEVAQPAPDPSTVPVPTTGKRPLR